MILALRPDAAPHSLTPHACFEDQEVMGEVMRVLWVGNTEVREGGGVWWEELGELALSGAKVGGKWSRNSAWKRWESETGSSVEGHGVET